MGPGKMTREEKKSAIGQAFMEAREARQDMAILRKKCLDLAEVLLQSVKILCPGVPDGFHTPLAYGENKEPDVEGLVPFEHPTRDELNQLVED